MGMPEERHAISLKGPSSFRSTAQLLGVSHAGQSLDSLHDLFLAQTASKDGIAVTGLRSTGAVVFGVSVREELIHWR